MHLVDYLVFSAYFFGVMAVGFYFFTRNKDKSDYFVGGRKMSAGHVGLSIVATDVGGGFSIGLGGLGFVMGISGSWLLFSGLVGAWLAAVLTVPKLKKLDSMHQFFTYPDFLRHRFDQRVAIAAAVISAIGYLGFTGAQILAGAKLAAGSLFSDIQWTDPLSLSLMVMAGIVIIYTVLGGIKAVIYTDTVQWIILLSGLSLVGIPVAWVHVGGWEVIQATLPDSHFSLTHISVVQLLNWLITIIPIWFIAMTLYQRVYAVRTIKEAKKAFFIAGVFEYPVMAFMGVFLGMLARVAFPDAESEMALPMLLEDSLPIGVAGFLLAAYFSAIMSTADSCLIASSGNTVNDVIEHFSPSPMSDKMVMTLSQVATLIIGVVALILAWAFQTVLEIILYAYAFMVSGLLIPTLAAYFSKQPDANAAFWSMTLGGGFTLVLIVTPLNLPLGFDPTIGGIMVSGIVYYGLSKVRSHG